MRTLRTLHKWLGLLVFLQVLIWMGSGFLISLFDREIAAGQTTLRAASEPVPLAGEALMPMTALPIEPDGLESLRLSLIDGIPVYRAQYAQGVRLLDARSGYTLILDGPMAERIARTGYNGAAEVRGIKRVDAPQELAKFEGSAWRVRFADDLGTRVYVDAADGRLLGHRNSRSAVQEFLLKLHFMDYDGGHDFNHPLIIGFAFLALWLAVSGVMLLISSLRRVGLR